VLTQGHQENYAYVADIANQQRMRHIDFPKEEIYERRDQILEKLFQAKFFGAKIAATEIDIKSIWANNIDDREIVAGEARISLSFRYKYSSGTWGIYNSIYVAKFQELGEGLWDLDIEPS
jgi:hypothetical protein